MEKLKMEELYHELMISQKSDELTPEAKDLLANYAKEVMEEWYNHSGKYSPLGKSELMKAGEESVFKYWKNFDGEKSKDPCLYFKEVFKRGVAKHYYKSTREYKDKKFLDSLHSLGLKILKFNLPHEIEFDKDCDSIIKKFSFIKQ